MFWSGETLKVRLPELISPYDPDAVDAAAYQLRIGHEVYVSPRQGDGPDKTKVQLKAGEAFTIPAGQFAFLVTEETVAVPNDALALISIRARLKFRGLVNISGFHVDPGYSGRLLFSVFNASPAPIHLERGQPCFLIWYAQLDRASAELRSGDGFVGVPVDLINPIAGEIQSLAGLATKLADAEKQLGERVHAVEREHMYLRTGVALALVLIGGIALRTCSSGGSGQTQGTPPSAVAPSGTAIGQPAKQLEPPRAGEPPSRTGEPPRGGR